MDKDNLARKVLKRLAQAQTGGGGFGDHMSLNTWEWPQGVALYAMLRMWERDRDPEKLSFLINWYDAWIQRGLPSRHVNTTAPMLCMTLLYEKAGIERYAPHIREWAEWVAVRMPRTLEGGLQHVTAHDDNPQQLWDDTLFMTCLFMYRAGVALDKPMWRSEAVYQFLLHIKYLHAVENALWRHGFTFDGRQCFAGAFWARGNGWITAGGVELLEMMIETAGGADGKGDDGLYSDPAARLIVETWRAQCGALADLQDGESGLWHTLLDDPSSYLETSGSAAIAYGMLKGLRLGLLPENLMETARRASQGVIRQIDADGVVRGVSYGTPLGRALESYKRIPLQPTAYGQGLTYLMLTEPLIDRFI